MLKLNIGFNRKVGEANYGSRGASVNLEIEVESGLVREPEKLQAKINYLFDLAKASVDAQLNGSAEPQQPPPVVANNNGGNGTYGNGSRQASGEHQQGGNGSTNGHYAGGNGRRTTRRGLGLHQPQPFEPVAPLPAGVPAAIHRRPPDAHDAQPVFGQSGA